MILSEINLSNAPPHQQCAWVLRAANWLVVIARKSEQPQVVLSRPARQTVSIPNPKPTGVGTVDYGSS